MPRHDRELWPYATCWAPASGSNLGPEHLSAGRGRDAAVQVMNTFVLRVHQHGRCIADNNHQDMGRSPGGLTSKIYAEVLTGPPRRTGMMFFAGVYGQKCTIIAKRTVLEKCPSENPPR